MIVERAPAKLNLALHVRRRRPDGYHDIETLFAFCADGDVVTVETAEVDSFEIAGPFAAALSPSSVRDKGFAGAAGGKGEDSNLVTRAAAAFCAAFGISANYRITLEKNLPVASGIGGGSADAAATLRAFAKLHDIISSDPRLVEVAAGLGADVPACLAGRAAFGTGRGDELVPIASLSGTPALLVNPGVQVSTAAVFAAWDGIDRGPLDPAAPANGRNDLEPAARSLAPAIDDVVSLLAARAGTTLVRMSGSGATCFALFVGSAARDEAAVAIRSGRPDWWQLATHLT